MDHEKTTILSEAQEKALKSHQTNLAAYSATTLFGVLMATVLIPNFVKLKKNTDFGPEKFPYIVAGIFVFLGILGLVMEITAMRKARLKISFPKVNLKSYIPQMVLVLGGFAFIGLASFLGFLPAAMVFVFGMLFLFGCRKWKFNLIFAIAYAALIFLLFSQILGIRFTGGLISF